MSTMPLNTVDPRLSASAFLKRMTLLAMVALVIALIYSGTAWFWLRPALHKPLINKYAGEYKIDPLWVMAVVRVESRFATHAQSSRGAIGLMPLLPSTAPHIAPEIR